MLVFIRLFPGGVREDRKSVESEEEGEEIHQGTY